MHRYVIYTPRIYIRRCVLRYQIVCVCMDACIHNVRLILTDHCLSMGNDWCPKKFFTRHLLLIFAERRLLAQR